MIYQVEYPMISDKHPPKKRSVEIGECTSGYEVRCLMDGYWKESDYKKTLEKALKYAKWYLEGAKRRINCS